MNHTTQSRTGKFLLTLIGLTLSMGALAQEPLFEQVGPPDAVNLPAHAVAGQNVRINRRALQSPSLSIELFGETYVAQRSHIDRRKAGQTVWVGHLQGNPGDTVILTLKGNAISGMIQRGPEMYRIGASSAAGNRLYMLDLELLPLEDVGGLPDGGGGAYSNSVQAESNTVQDLLVVYNQNACNSAGSCVQLEADIVTAVADINTAYTESGVNITMNLAGTHFTNYSGTSSGTALSDLAGTSDGQMDEVHGVRDSVGADMVSLVYTSSDSCGRGYVNSSPSSAFSVVTESCVVGNRSLAHELGHNQGAYHDRAQHGGGTPGAYHYGYRRCNDGGSDDFGSPYFRTFMSYSCSGSPRVGRVSNPNVNYSGVPQGVDPAVDPARGAWNARTLNESAIYVAGFRDAPATNPPNAPSGLVATANGSDTIDLDWLDNSGDETSFVVQSSPDGAGWSDLAALAANTTSYSDNGLAPETTRHYRVRAENGAGASGYSNAASDTTAPLPPSVEDVANGEVAIKGSVSGSYTATHSAGGAVQTITESHSGGPKKARKQSYEHAWTFDVFGGAGGVVVLVDAWVSGSEGANFYYSTDGGASRSLMFTVNNNASDGGQTFALPGGTAGAVRIEVQDAEQSNGEAVDSVTVDHIVFTSYTDAGDPPAAPSAMSVTGTTSSSVSVQFTDNSEDEFGFELWRATTDPLGDCSAGSVVDTLSASDGTGLVSHTDTSAAPSTTYWYWAKSFNGAGDNGSCSNAASGTTPAGSAISLSVNGYKVKGVKTVDLTWSGAAGANVDVYREGLLELTVPNTGAYTDSTGLKGGGTLTYQVCEQGSTTNCSDPATAAF
ncbi:MAG: hypothetical protein HKN58_04495 [Xanthomonadales bacterium]|nr:hypothetical protein [Xanthomonadales bacterium]